jgi:hypothetical protein
VDAGVTFLPLNVVLGGFPDFALRILKKLVFYCQFNDILPPYGRKERRLRDILWLILEND